MSPDTRTISTPKRIGRLAARLIGAATAAAVVGTLGTAAIPTPSEELQTTYPVAAQVLSKVAPQEAAARPETPPAPRVTLHYESADGSYINTYAKAGCKGKKTVVRDSKNGKTVYAKSWKSTQASANLERIYASGKKKYSTVKANKCKKPPSGGRDVVRVHDDTL